MSEREIKLLEKAKENLTKHGMHCPVCKGVLKVELLEAKICDCVQNCDNVIAMVKCECSNKECWVEEIIAITKIEGESRIKRRERHVNN